MPTSTTPRIDPLDENLIFFSQARRVLPGEPAYDSVLGWHRTGRLSVSGTRVHLEAIKTPRGYATTREAYRRFVEALNE